jgi:hypothetical protein
VLASAAFPHKKYDAFAGNTCALLDSGAVRCWGYNNFG